MREILETSGHLVQFITTANNAVTLEWNISPQMPLNHFACAP